MKIAFIGAGNVATQFAKAFFEKGFTIVHIYSRTEDSAKQLADIVKATYTTKLQDIDKSANVYFICIKDDVLLDIIQQLPNINGMVLHTSGATGIEALGKFENHGVFYPLQTLQKQVPIDLSQTPICIEANNDKSFKLTKTIAEIVSRRVYMVSTQQRLALHIAAVFANNFTHHLLTQAAGIIEKEQLPLQLLQSIITETFKKLDFSGAIDWKDLQTGPAKRGDLLTINKHSAYLVQNQPQLEELYRLLSESIITLSRKDR